MKITFLETNTLGTDVDLTAYDQIGEVIKYPITDQEQYSERIKDTQILIVNKIPMNASYNFV